jgi:DNA replication initiation complex subunit (GINS family)
MANALSGAKSVAMLKDIAAMLTVPTGGDRMSLEARVIEFLVKPSGSSAPSKKKHKKSSKKNKHTAASTTTSSRRNSSAGSGFSHFLKQRMPEVIEQAGGSMSARDVTELLTLEWKNMSHDERSEYEPKTERVIDEEPRIHKVISKNKSPRKSESTEEEGTDSSSSDSDSFSGSSDSSSSSGSDSDE